MNYKEMLDQFEYLEKKLAHLENENKHIKERVAKLEFGVMVKNAPAGPGFTPGTIPSPGVVFPQDSTWPTPNTIWCTTNQQYGEQ